MERKRIITFDITADARAEISMHFPEDIYGLDALAADLANVKFYGAFGAPWELTDPVILYGPEMGEIEEEADLAVFELGFKVKATLKVIEFEKYGRYGRVWSIAKGYRNLLFSYLERGYLTDLDIVRSISPYSLYKHKKERDKYWKEIFGRPTFDIRPEIMEKIAKLILRNVCSVCADRYRIRDNGVLFDSVKLQYTGTKEYDRI